MWCETCQRGGKCDPGNHVNSAAMYKVGEKVTMDGGTGSPGEDWKVVAVYPKPNGQVAVLFEPVPKFVPGWFQSVRYPQNCQRPRWCFSQSDHDVWFNIGPGEVAKTRRVRVTAAD